jgi:C-terminal processing protease CtpA/Prc
VNIIFLFVDDLIHSHFAQGYGFELGDDGFGNLVVTDLSMIGPARRSGVVRVGDFIFSVNREDISSCTLRIAAAAVEEAGTKGSATFVFGS